MTDTQIDILGSATEWAKTEMYHSAFFALFGIIFLAISFSFWQFGRTDTEKAYIIPLLVIGVLLMILGVGLVISNQLRLSGFEATLNTDYASFLTTEIARADKTISGYENVIYRVMPLIIISCAALLLFVRAPLWQASLAATIALMIVIVIIDSNAATRLADYKDALLHAQQK